MANTKTHLSWRLLREERLQKSCPGGFLRGASGRSGVLLFCSSIIFIKLFLTCAVADRSMDQMISRSDFFALSLQLHRNFFCNLLISEADIKNGQARPNSRTATKHIVLYKTGIRNSIKFFLDFNSRQCKDSRQMQKYLLKKNGKGELSESSMDHASFFSASTEQGPRTLDYPFVR
jgi:hypothetical protein